MTRKGRRFVRPKPGKGEAVTFPPEALEDAKQAFYRRVQNAEYVRHGLQSNWRPKRVKHGETGQTQG